MDLDIGMSPELEEQYRNHKVVALPTSRARAFGSEMEAVTTVQANMQQYPARTRSVSLGRPNYRSNDLVQNIYDRIGVNLKKGQGMDFGEETHGHMGGSEEKSAPPYAYDSRVKNSQERYNNASATSNRGRSIGREAPLVQEAAPDERRARSLSRGRLAQRWPPVSATPEEEEPEQRFPPAPSQNYSTSPKRQPPVSSPPPKQGSYHIRNAAMSPNRPTPNESNSSWVEHAYPANQVFVEEKKEEETENNRTIQDRMGAFSKPERAEKEGSVQSRQSYGMRMSLDYPASARDYPPKIDIYEGKKPGQAQQQDSLGGVSSAFGPPQAGTGANAETNPAATIQSPYKIAPPKLVLPPPQEDERSTIASPRGKFQPTGPSLAPRPAKSGNLANAFLAAINSKPQQPPVRSQSFRSPKNTSPSGTGAPVSEIAVGGENMDYMNMTDNVSMGGFSTVSGEDFSASPSKAQYKGGPESSKKPWQERNRLANYRPPVAASKPSISSYSGNFAVGNSDMERLIEDRVQARLADLEARIEQKLRVLVAQMEDKIMNRLDMLEHKMTVAVTKKKG